MNEIEEIELLTKEHLVSVKRKGMPELIKYMEKKGFFKSPASTKYHLACEGGLLKHSYSVFKLFDSMCIKFGLNVEFDTKVICSICHDLCKAGQYKGTVKPYSWNPFNGKGHASLSIERLKRFIELTPQEETIIKYHMGMYGTNEFSARTGEYSLSELSNIYSDEKIAKLFYFCDDMSSQFLEE